MKRLIPLVAAAILSGCWTFGTSEYPETQVSSAPAATNVTVAVSCFSAVLTGYRDLVSFNTVYVPGGYGYRRCYPGYVATVPTHTYIPEAQTTDRYRLRAVDAFERAGYAVGAAVPDWTVEVTFAGPVVTSGDSACEAATTRHLRGRRSYVSATTVPGGLSSTATTCSAMRRRCSGSYLSSASRPATRRHIRTCRGGAFPR